MWKRHKFSLTAVLVVAGLLLAGVVPAAAHGDGDVAENGLFFIDYRNLNGGADGVALVDLDPESPNFGQVLQNFELGVGVTPHHLYYNHDESRLYNTTLGGEFLYELIVERDEHGVPTIMEAQPIDVGESLVGEDMYFTEDGSRFYVTFIAGEGGPQGGTVGVFDAETNALLETIEAPISADNPSEAPFIMYPHGISANEDLGYLMVTSTSHPDGVSGVGNTLALIDLETHNVLENFLVSDAAEIPSAPVEVLLLRDDFPAYALTTAMLTGDIWMAAYDEDGFEPFEKVFSGAENGVAFALEFYIGPGGDPQSDEDRYLYVSHGVPGVIHVFGLDNLPELPLVKTLPAEAGAHHMAFFITESGREVMVVQNNLLNLNDPYPPLNAGTMNIIDIHSGEVLATFDMAGELGLMPESIEGAGGNAHYYHH